MIMVSTIVPILTLCLVLLYVVLFRRFLKIKSKLPFPGLKGKLGNLAGKRKKIVVPGILFFLAFFAGQYLTGAWAPDMLMVFNYEEAARGQNPNATRFNESQILSEDILEKVIKRGGILIDAEKLSGFLTISTPLDEEKLDVTQESNLKISTGYWIRCSEMVSLYQTDPQTVLNILADVYWEEFVRNYAENDSILDLSFDELEGMEYLDVKDYLQMQAGKVKNYLPGYSTDSSSFRAEGSGETFASLNEKVENYIDIELERYESFILENGLAKNKETYQSRMQYANRLLDTSKKKDMAAHDVRIETIGLYDAFMTRFVLIPTYDTEKEFYMSRTKVGVDYFADEAKELLESATKSMEKMEHNTYANEQVGKSRAASDVYEQADRKIEELKAELKSLSVQSRELCREYVEEKRDGYIQVGFSSPGVTAVAVKSLFYTFLFMIAKIGITVVDPLYREHGSKQDKKRERASAKGRQKRKKGDMV